jgi:endoglucanase
LELRRKPLAAILGAGLLAVVWLGCSCGASQSSEEEIHEHGRVRLRGANLVGMEGPATFDEKTGPVPDVEYAVHANAIIDYLSANGLNAIRFLFSWERMQSKLNGPVPAAKTGNYKSYFDDYDRIVDYATNVKGMTVIITPWQTLPEGGSAGGARWRGHLVGDGVVTNAHFADFWSKMATIYRDNPRVSIGLITEPNQMDTMRWFATAQEAITAIRTTGFGGEIYVPGNGWTAAGTWSDPWYDTASPKRSNADAWLNARGTGLPLADPFGKLVVEVHNYADPDGIGNSTSVVSAKISRERVKGVVDWARDNGLTVFIGEIGMYASAPNASANWKDFTHYIDDNASTVVGYAWWACGKPGWWNDVGANSGGHFSITPTRGYTADTVNMRLLKEGEPLLDGGREADADEGDGSTPTSDADAAESDGSTFSEPETEAPSDDTRGVHGTSRQQPSRYPPPEPPAIAETASAACSAAPRSDPNAGLLVAAGLCLVALRARRRS